MKTLKLDQTVAVVTGGNGGIGLGIAKGLAEAGAAVVITGRDAVKNADALSVLQRLQPNCRAEICDIRDRAAIKQLFLFINFVMEKTFHIVLLRRSILLLRKWVFTNGFMILEYQMIIDSKYPMPIKVAL